MFAANLDRVVIQACRQFGNTASEALVIDHALFLLAFIFC